MKQNQVSRRITQWIITFVLPRVVCRSCRNRLHRHRIQCRAPRGIWRGKSGRGAQSRQNGCGHCPFGKISGPKNLFEPAARYGIERKGL